MTVEGGWLGREHAQREQAVRLEVRTSEAGRDSKNSVVGIAIEEMDRARIVPWSGREASRRWGLAMGASTGPPCTAYMFAAWSSTSASARTQPRLHIEPFCLGTIAGAYRLCRFVERRYPHKAPIFLGKISYFSFRATLTALTRPLINSSGGVSVCNVLLSLCCTCWCISRPQTPFPS